MKDASPLRYPGGKWRITHFFEGIVRLNNLQQCHYVEPYAGGGSLALSLLFKDQVAEIHLNDLDPAIHAFWHSVLTRNSDFAQLLQETPVTPEEWINQKSIYSKGVASGQIELGFATFFLNRTNHSGILNAGMIGGRNQDGPWKLDARFNRDELVRRIKRVGDYKNRIHLTCEDATQFLRNRNFPSTTLFYLDPPYFKAGSQLYFNTYKLKDHETVSKCALSLERPWVVSYDDVPEIRSLYKGVKSRRLQLLHTARSARNGQEVLFFSDKLRIPKRLL